VDLNHLFFAEIKSFLKRKENNGLLEFHIRGDGTLTSSWDDLVNQISSGSRNWDGWLHDTDENSQPFRAEIPVIIRKRRYGEVIWTIDWRHGYKKLNLHIEAELRLTKYFEIPEDFNPIIYRASMDRRTLAYRYKDLIDQGYFRNKADLARHLGVSRAWITKVMNELKQSGCN
jgi:hypothetical protein